MPIEKLAPGRLGIFYQFFAINNFKAMRGANHIDQISAPGRIDPARQPENIRRDLVQSRSSHDAAHLRFFSKHEQIRNDLEMLATPGATGRAEAGLHFIEDQKNFVFITNAPQRPQPFSSKMVVAAFTLDGLDDDCRKVRRAGVDDVAQFSFDLLLACDDATRALGFGQDEIKDRRRQARPIEFREVICLAWVGVGEAQRVAAASMKRALEMDDCRPAISTPGGDVFAHLPIHRGFEGILDGEGAAFDEEVTLQWYQAGHAREGGKDLRHVTEIHIRVGDFDASRFEQILLHSSLGEVGMVESNRQRSIKTVEIDNLPARGGIDQVRSVAFLQIDDDAKAIEQEMLFQFGYDAGGWNVNLCSHGPVSLPQ